ncbi:MAG: hypothetical protein WA131_10405 [Desulfitobacteriaceae bacterium]
MSNRVLVILGLALFLTGCGQTPPLPLLQDLPSVSQPIQTVNLTKQIKESSHNKVGIGCQVCHYLGGKDLISLKKPGWESCGSCHSSSPLVLGQVIQHPQYDMIKGTGIGEVVPNYPSLKYRLGDKFACYDCHLMTDTRHSFTVPGSILSLDVNGTSNKETTLDYNEFKKFLQTDRCAACHIDPDASITQLSQHREEIEQKLNYLRQIYTTWEKKVATLDPADPRVKAFNEGRSYYTYVEADGSKGAHNYDLSVALLNKAIIKFSILK